MVESQSIIPGSQSESDPLKDRHISVDDQSTKPSFTEVTLLLGIPLVAVIFFINTFSVFETSKAIVALFLSISVVAINLLRPILGSSEDSSAQPSLGQAIKQNPLYIPSALVIFALLLSCVSSLEPTVSLFGNDRAQTTVFFYLMLISAMILSFNKSAFSIDRTLMISTLIACFLVSIYSIMQALGLDPITWSAESFGLTRSFSTIGNPISLAAFHVLTIPICVAAVLTIKGRALQVASVFILMISLQSLIITYSRAGWLAAILSLVVMSVLFFIYIKDLRRRFILLLLILTFFSVSATIIVNTLVTNSSDQNGPSIESKVVDRVLMTSGGLDGSANSRLLAWKSTLVMISEQPVVGFGPLTFTDVWPRYRDSAQFGVDGQIRYYDNPHNFFLELFVSGGLSLFLGVLWLIILSTMLGWKSLIRDRLGSRINVMTIALMVSVIGFCAAIFFSFVTVATAYLFVLFLVILAGRRTKDLWVGSRPVNFSVSSNEDEQNTDNADTSSNKNDHQVRSGVNNGGYFRSVALRIVFIIICFLILLSIVIGEIYYERGSDALDPLQPVNSADLRDLQRSVKIMPWRIDHQIGYAGAILRSLDTQKDLSKSAELKSEALDILIKVIDDQPTQRLAYYELLEHSIGTKNVALAKQLTVAAFELDPMDPIATYYLGEIALLEGDEAKALKAFRHSYKLQSLNVRPLRKMVVIYLDLGDKTSAIEVLDTIIEIDKNDVTSKKIRKSLISNTGNDHE